MVFKYLRWISIFYLVCYEDLHRLGKLRYVDEHVGPNTSFSIYLIIVLNSIFWEAIYGSSCADQHCALEMCGRQPLLTALTLKPELIVNQHPCYLLLGMVIYLW